MMDDYSITEFMSIMGSKIFKVWDVILANTFAVGVSITAFQTGITIAIGVLTIVSLISAIGFTWWRWRRLYLKGKKEEAEKEQEND